jgi:hypothetical protein
VTDFTTPTKLAQEALRGFRKTIDRNRTNIVRLRDLLDRVNQAALAMNGGDGADASPSSRVKLTFTERSFRHYQTLGCIDVPEKCGRMASYGYRHFVQALLVRRLLSERVPSEQILTLARRDTKELESMLRDGVEIAARPGDEDADTESFVSASEVMEVWNRMRLAPGLELHIHSKFPEVDKEEFERISALLERILMNRGS